MAPVQLLIVEDHGPLGEVLEALLRADERLEIASVADDLDTAVTAARELPVDVALVDIDLGKQDGFAVVEALRAVRPAMVALMMTTFDPVLFQCRADAVGARAILLKTEVVRRGGDVVVRAFRAARS